MLLIPFALCKTALIFMLRTSVSVTVSKIPAMHVETTDLLTFSFGKHQPKLALELLNVLF